jgi:hypothetical protein
MGDTLGLLAAWALCTASATWGLAGVIGAAARGSMAAAEECWLFLFVGVAGMAVLLVGTIVRHQRGPDDQPPPENAP